MLSSKDIRLSSTPEFFEQLIKLISVYQFQMLFFLKNVQEPI
jgi:hypothetical protein